VDGRDGAGSACSGLKSLVIARKLARMKIDTRKFRSLRFKPWIGRWYGSRHGQWSERLLVVGESQYGVGTRNLTCECVSELGYGLKGNRFSTVVSQFMVGKDQPRRCERIYAWDSVAFMNFIQSFVGDSPRHRPTEQMWEESALPFRKAVGALNPQRILLIGKELIRQLAERGIAEGMDVTGAGPWLGCLRIGRRSTRALGLPHPAGRGTESRSMIGRVQKFLNE